MAKYRVTKYSGDPEEVEAKDFVLAGNDHEWTDFRKRIGNQLVIVLRVPSKEIFRIDLVQD